MRGNLLKIGMGFVTVAFFAWTVASGPRLSPAAAETAKPSRQAEVLVARGRYLVRIGGCNDCHTGGFAASDAKIPEADWLEGSPLGFRGPWGTTYAINLRQFAAGMTEAQWQAQVVMPAKPPMPWWALKWMTSEDRRALYAFIRHLGASTKETPADLPPGVAPPAPFISWPSPPAAAGKP
jgi:hypothetical protein